MRPILVQISLAGAVFGDDWLNPVFKSVHRCALAALNWTNDFQSTSITEGLVGDFLRM